MAWPSAARSAQDRYQAGLGRVVEAAGRLVEEEQWRAGGQDDGQGEGEALALRQVAGVGGVRDPGQQFGDQGAAGARFRVRVAVRGRALGGHRVRVQQVARLLRYEAHAAYEFTGRRAGAGTAPPTRTEPDAGSTSPTSALSRVDFPAPLRPMRAMVSPGATVRLTSWRASMPPRRTVR